MTQAPLRPTSQVEFIAMVAMLAATIAFSIDAMLPVLVDIGTDLSPDDTNKPQLVIAAFVVGMGLGTLFAGPLSDAFGRRTVAVWGAALYIVSAVAGAVSMTIELLLVARFFQGVGASGPRVVAMALVRDLFVGRQMARILSFTLTVFTLVPVIAPTMGAFIAAAFGWRAIFVSFAVFSVVSICWLLLRQPETLPPDRRRPFRLALLVSGVKEILSHRVIVASIAIQTLFFAILFSALMSSAQIFDVTFGRGETFHYWFGLVAALSATASVLNATIVVRVGMQRVILGALLMQLVICTLFLIISVTNALSPTLYFAAFIVWFTTIFFMVGLGVGNLNSIAMEPVGHLAGLASSIIAASATVFSAVLAAPVGLAFDGTPTPLALGVLVFVVIGLLLSRYLYTPDNP